MKRLLVVAAALAFSAGAAAQMYKWKDANGHVRYGDTPPPGADATPIRAPAPVAPPPSAGKPEGKGEKPLSPEAAFRKRQEEREAAEQKAAKERADAAEKRANCGQAQAALRQLQSGQRVATINAAGERVFLDDAQRAAEQARAQQAADQWCR